MFNEIKELLKQGKEVQLECIDQEGWLSMFIDEKDTSNILLEPIIIKGIDEDNDIVTKNNEYIFPHELKFFKIVKN